MTMRLREYQDSWPHGIDNDVSLRSAVRCIKAKPEQSHEEEVWRLDADYQRDAVWTKQQQELFVGHHISGGPSPKIYIQRWGQRSLDRIMEPCEVLDGKQRLMALYAWYHRRIAACMCDGTYITYHQLNLASKRGVPNVRVTYIDLPRAERLHFYLRLNSGGTVHTTGELEKVQQLLKEEQHGEE